MYGPLGSLKTLQNLIRVNMLNINETVHVGKSAHRLIITDTKGSGTILIRLHRSVKPNLTAIFFACLANNQIIL